jgi:hypothetical protein
VSDQNRPGDAPPELPPEYAEAYRRGYERAYRQAAGEDEVEPIAEPVAVTTPERPATTEHRPLFADEVEPAPPLAPTRAPVQAPAPVQEPVQGGAHRADPAPVPFDDVEGTDEREPDDRPVWLVPALLAGLVVVLLLGAYGIGRVLSDNLADTDTTPKKPDGIVMNENGSPSTSATEATKPSKPKGKKYTGDTRSADIGGASATCQSPGSVDSAGHKVRYDPSNVYDEDLTTAWRCNGDGSGQRLTIDLADKTEIGEVGLVPGYAKTDPRSGVNRYAENNRLTRVRWVFDNGTAVEQTFDPSVKNRSIQSIRIPVTKSSRVVVEILDAQRGPRNTVAVSELRIGQVS